MARECAQSKASLDQPLSENEAKYEQEKSGIRKTIIFHKTSNEVVMMRKPRNIGYVRVSRENMNDGRQMDQLRAICDEIYTEKRSAVAKSRPQFEAALASLHSGDSLIVLDLDRAFRSTIDALLTVELLKERGANLRILSLNLDLSTEYGELIFAVFSAFAQFERRILSRRTKEGLAAARRRGVKLGRPRKSKRPSMLVSDLGD